MIKEGFTTCTASTSPDFLEFKADKNGKMGDNELKATLTKGQNNDVTLLE